MLVKFFSSDPKFPPPVRRKPLVQEEERALARLQRPPALSSHCKPWLDAGALGWTLLFPFQAELVVIGRKTTPRFEFRFSGPSAVQDEIVSNFASGYFSVGTNCRFRTPPGVGLLLQSTDDKRRPPVVSGVVQTWWYSKPLFVVFPDPPSGRRYTFRYGNPLCVIVPVPCETMQLAPCTRRETQMFLRDETRYNQYLHQHPEAHWMSAEGNGFSHAYKLFAKVNVPKE